MTSSYQRRTDGREEVSCVIKEGISTTTLIYMQIDIYVSDKRLMWPINHYYFFSISEEQYQFHIDSRFKDIHDTKVRILFPLVLLYCLHRIDGTSMLDGVLITLIVSLFLHSITLLY